jgi:hypothetical protein
MNYNNLSPKLRKDSIRIQPVRKALKVRSRLQAGCTPDNNCVDCKGLLETRICLEKWKEQQSPTFFN